jgi:NHL repeat
VYCQSRHGIGDKAPRNARFRNVSNTSRGLNKRRPFHQLPCPDTQESWLRVRLIQTRFLTFLLDLARSTKRASLRAELRLHFLNDGVALVSGVTVQSRVRRAFVMLLGAFWVVGGGIHEFATSVAAGSPQIYIAGGVLARLNDMTGAGRITVDASLYGGKYELGGHGVFVDRVGRIYLTQDGQIIRLNDMTGKGWIVLGSGGAGVRQFSTLEGIFVDDAGRIYVADYGNDRIVRVDDMTGSGWTTLGTRGAGIRQFLGPAGIYVDKARRIYVADSGNGRIVRTDDMTGAGWVALGTRGAGVNQFSAPYGIFVDGTGRIYVGDLQNSRIIRIDNMTGAGWTTLGTLGKGVNQFNGPYGVFVDGAGRIYVADAQSMFDGRIVRMDDMTGAGWTTLDVGFVRSIFVH